MAVFRLLPRFTDHIGLTTFFFGDPIGLEALCGEPCRRAAGGGATSSIARQLQRSWTAADQGLRNRRHRSQGLTAPTMTPTPSPIAPPTIASLVW